MKLFLCDTQTNERKELPSWFMNFEGWEYNLTEGNSSCDCNRDSLFDRPVGPCGDSRYKLEDETGNTPAI